MLEASRRIVDSIAERERLLEAMRRWSDAAARDRIASAAASAVPVTAAAPVTGAPVEAPGTVASAGSGP
ncbi:hypothetical protein, partial [Clavibacter lycopersici]|uniref:hypothetical protein n=1 Tax=Clavibacter lycopersici TaxID=2301718 RepID=UPI001F30CE6A